MNSSHSQTIEIKIWVWSLLSFALFNAVLFAVLAHYVSNKMSNDNINLETLDEIARIKTTYPNDKVVAVVGSSKVQSGFYCPSYYKQFFETSDGNNVHVFKIHQGGYQWEHFSNELNIVNRLSRSAPDLLLIEMEIVLFDFGNRTSSWYNNYGRYLNQIRYVKNHWILKKQPNQLCDNPYSFNSEDSSKVTVAKRKLKNLDQLDPFLQRMSVLQKQNIEVGIIELPYPRPTQLLIDENVDVSRWNCLLSTLQKDYQINYLKMEDEMYWPEFKDIGHLNKKGRQQFNTWFLSYLQSKWNL